MGKRLLVCAVVLLLVAGISLAGEKEKAAKEDTWKGWVTDTMCGAKGQKAAHADCATKCVKEMGAKWALYNSSDGKVYVLEPQEKAAEHAGHHVKVKGSVEGNTIKAAAIEVVAEEKAAEKKM